MPHGRSHLAMQFVAVDALARFLLDQQLREAGRAGQAADMGGEYAIVARAHGTSLNALL
jgi:hypothetical protein